MSLQCFPSSFCSIQLTVSEMLFEEFQYGCHGGHLGYQYGPILAILNLYVAPMPPIKFWLNWTYCFGGMSFEEFQDGRHGGHLGYQNRTILAILNLYNAQMPPIKFRLNLTSFGRRCGLKNLKMAPWWLFWLLEWNDFSNSESLCPCDASHQNFGSIQLKV